MYQLIQTGQKVDQHLNTIIENENKIKNIPTQNSKVDQQTININNILNNINSYYNGKTFCDKTYPIGSIYKAYNNINPNTIFPGTTWQTVENINDQDYVNNYFGTTNLEVITHNDGSKWVPLVLHCVDKGATLYTAAQAKQCATIGKISNLYLLEKTHDIFKNGNGQYEFILEYPEWQGWNRWKQTSNPVTSYDSISGYSGVFIKWSKGFNGMAQSPDTTYCFLDCSSVGSGSGNWWYAICSYRDYNSGIPGPNNGSTTSYYFTYLYVRVPSLEKTSNISDESSILNNINYIEWKRTA